MRKKKKEELGFSRSDVHRFLYEVMTETLNEGLVYDENAKKEGITEQDFNEVLNEYRLYGNLFGLQFITKIMNKLDNLVEDYRNNEKKEN